MDPRLEPQCKVLRLNSRLLRNCLAGVDDVTARIRLEGRTNSLAFLALHLEDARHYLCRYLGGTSTSPFKELLDPIRSIDEMQDTPSLDAILDAWAASEAPLLRQIARVAPDAWDEPSQPAFPLGDTRLDATTFLVQHESYHVGQMGLLRRALGLPAMSYAADDSNGDTPGDGTVP